MKTSFDTDGMLFGILNDARNNGGLSITGGVYTGDTRPVDSTDEDVVVNSIDLEQDALPQIGTSNVNIYSSDIDINVKGKMMLMANRSRLDVLTNEVLAIIRNARFDGCKATPANIAVLAVTNVKQHYVNIRVNWNIAK